VLILFGSPHTNGINSKLLKFFLKIMTTFLVKNSYKFSQVNTYDLVAASCIDCGFCKVSPCCRFSDLKELEIKFQKCDILIIATPIYNLTFPVPLKIILDRTQKYFYQRFFQNIRNFVDKKRHAILIVTGEHSNDFGVNVMIRQLQNVFSLINTELIGTIPLLHFCGNYFDETKFYNANKDLLHDILEKISKC
jgi:multimeric flavodoxin WrbA